MKHPALEQKVRQTINALYKTHGPQGWWPRMFAKNDKDFAFEVALGAMLTQNSKWKNVEKALICLAQKRLLTPQAIVAFRSDRLASCIRASGYFRQKAKKIKAFAKFVVEELKGDLRNLGMDRERLLALWGIGPETADTILLYGLNQPVFVVDTYTRRLLVYLTKNARWLITPYEQIRQWFESFLPRSLKGWQEAHALIVKWGKIAQTPPNRQDQSHVGSS